MSALLPNLLQFGRLLHAMGLDVHAGRMVDVANALRYIDIGHRSDFYFTLRSLLIHRSQDLEPFDEAFLVFWRRPPGEWSANDLRALGEQRRFSSSPGALPAARPSLAPDQTLGALTETVPQVAPMSYSSQEVSRSKDFARFSEEELQQAKALIAALTWDPGNQRTRRWIPGRGGVLDLRRVLRHNLAYAGEPLVLPTRRRGERRRPVILLCDVSGSMDRYSRMLLHFIHSMSSRLGRVEAFLFATRLNRITRDLRRRTADEAVQPIVQRVSDWAGGTRIGEALRTFNVQWARRTLRHGPIVLLISDGWDRGDPVLLRQEMARLQRNCYRLIWLNPLLGSPDYQPLTRGMQAALPFVDDFLPVHNLESLEALAGHLNKLNQKN